MRLFVSGTHMDIRPFREKVYEMFATIPFETMENFETSKKSVTATCRERMAICTHYLLIVGARYGYVPPESADGLSITELEYEFALEHDLEMAIYIWNPGPDHVALPDDNPVRLAAFKQRLQRHTPREFSNVRDLEIAIHRSTDWYYRAKYIHGVPAAAPARLQTEQAIVHAQTAQIVLSESPLPEQLAPHLQTVQAFIQLLPPSVRKDLLQALLHVRQRILDAPDEFRAFLQHYRFPFRFADGRDAGLAELLQHLMLVQLGYPQWKFQHFDHTANLMLADNRWMRLLFAEHKFTTMPQALLQMARSLYAGPSGHLVREVPGPIFPHRMVMSHFYKGRDNICEYCGEPFPFDNLLPDYAEGEPVFQLVGEEPQLIAKLKESRVCCQDCLEKRALEANDTQELKTSIGEVI